MYNMAAHNPLRVNGNAAVCPERSPGGAKSKDAQDRPFDPVHAERSEVEVRSVHPGNHKILLPLLPLQGRGLAVGGKVVHHACAFGSSQKLRPQRRHLHHGSA